jgi:hypothetical protein
MVDVDSVPGRRGHGIGRGPSIMTTSSEESGLVEVIAAITFLFLQRSEPRRHQSARDPFGQAMSLSATCDLDQHLSLPTLRCGCIVPWYTWHAQISTFPMGSACTWQGR